MEAKRFLQSRYSPFRELVGVVFTEIESGYSKSVLEVGEKLFNAGGFLHGGVAYTLADSGMGVALWASLGEDEVWLNDREQDCLFQGGVVRHAYL